MTAPPTTMYTAVNVLLFSFIILLILSLGQCATSERQAQQIAALQERVSAMAISDTLGAGINVIQQMTVEAMCQRIEQNSRRIDSLAAQGMGNHHGQRNPMFDMPRRFHFWRGDISPMRVAMAENGER